MGWALSLGLEYFWGYLTHYGLGGCGEVKTLSCIRFLLGRLL